MYIEEICLETSVSPVCKLAGIAQLYTVYVSRMQQFGVMNDTRMHTTRLKQKLLTDMQAQGKGRDVILVFDKDIGAALGEACEQDSDNEAICLAHAAQIACQHMFDPWLI